MTPLALGIFVALAAGAAACFLASLVSLGSWRLGRARIQRMSAARRTPLLALLRLLPAAAAMSAAALTFNAFIRLEPANESESVGLVLASLAAAAIVALAVSLFRACSVWRHSVRTVAAWRHEPITGRELPTAAIDTVFPVVAVVGVWKPRLYIARQVLASCNAQELDAIAAHEGAHVRAGDNVVRLLFLCAPAAGFGAGAFAEIARAWVAAAEERADDCARPDAQQSLALASALTKVARLAANTPAPVLHASSILSGSTVEARVRRLFAPPPATGHLRMWPAVLLAEAAVVTAAISPAGSRALYELAEFCVRHLP